MVAFVGRGRYAARLEFVTAITLPIVFKAEEIEPGAGRGTFGSGHGIVVIRLSAQCTAPGRFGKATLCLVCAGGGDSDNRRRRQLFIYIEPVSSSALLVWISRAVEAA